VDVVIAATLGLSAHSDAFYAAFILPQTVGRWMFQGLTNSFMGFFAEEGQVERQLSYSRAITVVVVVAVALSFSLSLGSPGYMPFIIPAAALETKQMAVSLARLLAWTIYFLALAETFRAIYYREAIWWFPSAARLVGGALAIAVILAGDWAARESTAALAITLGACIEMLTSFVGLYWRAGLRYRFSWPDKTTLRGMAALVGAPLAGQGIGALATVGEQALASLLSPGSITAVAYARRIIGALRRSVFRGFVTTTIYAHVSGSRPDARAAMRLVSLIAIPLAVVIGALSYALVAVVFGRGRFDAKAIETLAVTLQAYAPAIIGLALVQVPLGIAYGQKQSRGVFGFFVSVSVVLLTAEWTLLRTGFGLRAFGWGYGLALGLTFVWFYPYVTGLRLWRVFSHGDWGRILGAGLVVWLGTSLIAFLVGQVVKDLRWSNLLTLAAGLMGCSGLFVGVGYFLRLPEFRRVFSLLKSNWKHI